MTNGTDSLAYELYKDSGRSTVYPSAPTGAASIAASNNAQAAANIYGTITAFQNVQAGSYSETITFTVEY
jgi:spore coat protein U-like protein